MKVAETIRAYGLTVFASGAGLVSPYDKGTVTELGRALLASQNPELLLQAFETWTEEGEFDELNSYRRPQRNALTWYPSHQTGSAPRTDRGGALLVSYGSVD